MLMTNVGAIFVGVLLLLFMILLSITFFTVWDAIEERKMIKEMEKYHALFSFPKFFKGECRTYDGLFIDRIWMFSDKELNKSPHVMHYLFPREEKESGYYPFLTDDDVKKILSDGELLGAVKKSAWIINDFWQRGGIIRARDVSDVFFFLGRLGMNDELNVMNETLRERNYVK